MGKLRRVLLAAAVLIAGGMGVRQALRQASIAEGMNCAEWQVVLDDIEDEPEYLPLARILQRDCDSVRFNVRCSELPDGSLCLKGHRHGPGQVTNLPPGDPGLSAAYKCDPADGTPIPCGSSLGRNWWKHIRDGDFDRSAMFRRVRRMVEDRERVEE